MKKFKFTLYGVWIGVRNAILGSVLFGVLATPLILLYFSITQGENAFTGLDFRFLTAGIGMVIFYCIAFFNSAWDNRRRVFGALVGIFGANTYRNN